MGMAFRRDLFLVTRQVYPELQDKDKLTHTKIQRKLLRKLGDNSFPFFFEVSNQTAAGPGWVQDGSSSPDGSEAEPPEVLESQESVKPV